MKLTKIIVSNSVKISQKLIKQLSLEKGNHEKLEVYTGIQQDEGDTYNLLLIQSTKDTVSFLSGFIKKSISVIKILIVSEVEILDNEDIKKSDVIIPNAFISKEQPKPIFIDYAIGENFDLTKFSLHLSGMCISGNIDNDNQQEYLGDVYEPELFSILSEIKKTDLINKVVVITGVKGDEMIENTSAIVGFVL